MKYFILHQALWGTDHNDINSYHRLGDCLYFKFQTFQVIRTFSIFVCLIHIFLMFYLDMKRSLFLIQDWKTTFIFGGLLAAFMYSGYQRVKLLVETKIYFVLQNMFNHSDDIVVPEEFESYTRPYSSWKSVIILYELAVTVAGFHTYFFWTRWYDDMIDYYEDREPHTRSNVIVRLVLAHMLNAVPPALIIFDFLFSKIVFNFRHWLVPVFFLLVYKLLNILGHKIIKEQDLPNTDANNADNPIFLLASLGIIAGVFFGLTIISKFKFIMFKTELSRTKQDMYLEHCVRELFLDALSDKFDSLNADISRSEEALDVARGEVRFAKEVLKNYGYRDSGKKDNIPEIAFTISIRPATPKSDEFKFISEKELMLRNKQSVYFSQDIVNHVELMDRSDSLKSQ